MSDSVYRSRYSWWDPKAGELWQVADDMFLILEVNPDSIIYIEQSSGTIYDATISQLKAITDFDYLANNRLPLLIS